MGSNQFLARKIFVLRQLFKRKTLVFLVSGMRTGSTLLKSLLASAPDVSHLPEVDFQQYNNWNSWKLKSLSSKPIVILKKPAAFHDSTYPQVPSFSSSKTIVLVRDTYETILSLERMMQQVYPQLAPSWTHARLLHEYWYPVYAALLDYGQHSPEATIYIRYEDLIRFPLESTQKLFHFIGSEQTFGVDSYSPPPSHSWTWGKDDGGRKIKTLKVQNTPIVRDNHELLALIQASEKVMELRLRLGYC